MNMKWFKKSVLSAVLAAGGGTALNFGFLGDNADVTVNNVEMHSKTWALGTHVVNDDSDTTDDGRIFVGGGATHNENLDNNTGNSTGKMIVNENSTYNGQTSSNDKAVVEAMAERIRDRVEGTTTEGLVKLYSELQVMTSNADGTVKLLGSGLGNGLVAAANIHQRYSAWNAVRDHMISASGKSTRFPGSRM